MADRPCSLSHSPTHPGSAALPSSSSLSAPPPDPCDPADPREQILSALAAVRDLLHLLSDCAAAHAGNTATDMRADSLAVVLRDLSEQLAAAEPLIDDMADLARDHEFDTLVSRDIEAQGAAVYAVRHTLRALHDAIGLRRQDRHPVDAEAFAGAAHRMAERLAGVEARITALSFSRHAAIVIG